MMRQYQEMKRQAPDALLLFRMGDFYELFFEDAQEASRLLGLTLTSRDKGENPIPMAGFPYHSLDGHLRKLIELGKRVAVCEQVEDPKQATGLVKRDITRVVTPGTITDEALLDPRQSNFLAAVASPAKTPDRVGLAWLDVSTGRLFAATLAPNELTEELARLEPAEVLLADDRPAVPEWFAVARPPAQTPRPAFGFSLRNAHELLCKHFGVKTLSGFGIADDAPAAAAAGALLAYLYETQRTDLRHISQLAPYQRGAVMLIDPVTRRSLELTRTLRENRRDGTLLDCLDRTVTAGGARTLADWISQPLVELDAIRYRQSAVEEWKQDPAGRRELREFLKQTYDVERLIARVSTGRTSPRDLGALRQSLRCLPGVKAKLAARVARFNADVEQNLDLFPDLRRRLENELEDDPPWTMRDGGIIRAAVHPELDELRDIARGGKQWIASFQRAEAERSGIANLKVGFNKVFGYYIEIPNSGRDKVPATYQRKQTIKNAERYITPELKEYEEKVLGAEERSKNLEYDLFCQLRDTAAEYTTALQSLAVLLGQLDCILGLAEIAATRQYVRPELTDDAALHIDAGRHPVLDESLPAGRFIPNDTKLGGDNGRFLLITGPNMAGKSTYIRQVALISLMAQIGSFVPASKAAIGIADRIFTRVGASDELGRGQSTFMVEMTETANILNNATDRSLVILDEIGRGTSTYDGVSLAWAISEQLHDKIGCRTLFATHYHELIELEKTLDGLRNRNVAVREWNEEIIFLHQIIDGGADRSYGIHVARLAGVPAAVLHRAQQILHQLERDPFGEAESRAPASQGQPKKHRRAYHQLSLFPAATAHPVLDAVRMLDAETLTPNDALRKLRELKSELEKSD